MLTDKIPPPKLPPPLDNCHWLLQQTREIPVGPLPESHKAIVTDETGRLAISYDTPIPTIEPVGQKKGWAIPK